MKGLRIILTFIFFSIKATAQPPNLYFDKITTQNGLSHNKVNAIIQDQRGFIWIGTNDGLNRFDGKNFVKFRHRQNDSTTISGNIITGLHEDRDGRIWITTADGGLSSYNFRKPQEDQFDQYKHIPGKKNSLPGNILNGLVEDNMGNLWLATSGHAVVRFDKKTKLFTQFIPQGTKTILALRLGRNDILWAGRQGGGILKINTRTGEMEEDARYRDLYAKLPHAAVTSLYGDKENNMWFGSWDKVVYKYNYVSGQEEIVQPTNGFAFKNDEIHSFAEDSLGRIWMGGRENGLHIYDKKLKRFYNYSYDPSRDGSISDNRINCIYMDRQGRVWIGTNKGICINDPARQQFVQHFLENSDNATITVYDFYEDRDHILWIGTSNGIYLKHPDGVVEKRKLQYKGETLHITSFFRDANGDFYLGTDYSLFRYQPAANKLTLLPNTSKDGVMKKIIDSRIVSIIDYTISGDPVLVTSPYGHYLTYYNKNENKWISRLDTTRNIIKNFNLKDNLIRKFYRSGNGIVWLATAKEGLGMWNNKGAPHTVYFKNIPGDPGSISNDHVSDIAEDEKGNLWVSTFGGGLNYFEVNKNKFNHISASPNLIESIQLDLHGNVWMISNGQLHKYDPLMKSYTSYTLPDLEKSGGVRGKLFRSSEGRIYLSGNNYFISFHPDSIRDVKTPPKIYLTGFSIFNKWFSHLLLQDKIKLKYNQNYFAFEFSAPDYSGSEVQYSYMMEGFDKDWTDAGSRNYVSYPNLEGGEYIFKVRASNKPGTWENEYASIKLEIVPPFWKRSWFYLSCMLAIAAISYLIYRYRINELLNRQAIRNRIAQDLHDNVGSTLSSISVYSQVAKIYHNQQKQSDLQSTLEKISSTSSEMISELNDTVWAINPRNDNMLVIFQRMESFARPLLASQEINLHFIVDRSIGSFNLDMEKRKNFYLIYKEAINNALKYSQCRNVWVNILQKGSHIQMKIKDDGKGFELGKTSEGFKSSDVYGGGNGLKNMQLRAREMKGSLGIKSLPEKGTTIELDFPIT